MIIPTYNSERKNYILISTGLYFLNIISDELVKKVEAVRHSPSKHEAIYLGLENKMGDNISRHPLSVYCALAFRDGVIIKTERVYYLGENPQAQLVELAQLVPDGKSLVLKINARQNVGVNPSFLEEFARKYVKHK